MGWLSFLEIFLNKLGNVITLDGKLAVNKDRKGLVRTYFTEILFNLKQNSSFINVITSEEENDKVGY